MKSAELAKFFDEFTDKWGARYPAIIRLWNNAWSDVPSLDYGACCEIGAKAAA